MNYRDTLLLINMENTFYNIEKLRKINDNKKVKAVVKANAYGHGLVGFSYILEKYDMVDSFCVSNLDEALALRQNGLKKPILVLGAVDKRHFDICLSNDITITIYSKEVAMEVIDFNKKIRVQFKIDTAMNRIGFIDIDEFNSVLEEMKKSEIIIDGIFSHFCSAEDDAESSMKQIESFKKFLTKLPKDIEIHIQNSAGSINYQNLEFTNAIRLGIGMYGLNPVEDTNINLKELITLKSRIIMTKCVCKNQTISYNRTYKLEKDAIIATVPLGYADGFKLAYCDNYAYAKDENGIKRFPIRGKICMDQIMIEVDSSVEVGDYVTFVGEEFNVSELAKRYGLSKYEILTSFSERLYKIYTYKGEVIFEDNQILKDS